MIPYETNRFGGALLNILSYIEERPELSSSPELFADSLNETIIHLKKQNLQLAWMSVPLQLSRFIEPAVSRGFIYHHADETGAELVCRLQPDAYIPGYATHYIGAGGVVVNEKDELLVIQERFHVRKHYKLPGGAMEPGEHIAEGVIREVEEETGIRTEFVSLNCFRHWHGYRFGKSDIYFVCRLKPLNSEIVIEPAEISHAVWMPVQEYLDHPDTHPFNRRIVESALSGRGLTIGELPGSYDRETRELFFSS